MKPDSFCFDFENPWSGTLNNIKFNWHSRNVTLSGANWRAQEKRRGFFPLFSERQDFQAGFWIEVEENVREFIRFERAKLKLL